eukprot:1145204-Pelagomonas_calceolata.AAC.2
MSKQLKKSRVAVAPTITQGTVDTWARRVIELCVYSTVALSLHFLKDHCKAYLGQLIKCTLLLTPNSNEFRAACIIAE